MPEGGYYDGNIQHILTQLIAFVVTDGRTYVSYNTIFHNGMNSPPP